MELTDQNKQRFYRHIEKTSSGCWTFKASPDPEGYCRLKINNKSYLAHRVSYMIHKGEIPDGMQVCHTCDVPSCVRPEHLFLGTNLDNARDRTAKGRDILFSGERHGNHKLTTSQVLRMRELPFSSAAIARMFHVTSTQIKRIRKFQAWKHVPVQGYLFNQRAA